MKSQEDEPWKWVDCPLVICRITKNSQNQQISVFESLDTSIMLADEQIGQKKLSVTIQMEKQFSKQEQKGFVWHKNCLIPQIKVTIKQNQFEKLKNAEELGDVYCEIASVYIIKSSVSYLKQAPLEGQTKKLFETNSLKFANLKFTETSFTNKKNKFSIIVWIYTENHEKQKNTLRTMISSQIYIDSRKQARKKITSKSLLSQKIQPSKFTQKIILKVHNKDLIVQNSIESFLNFYGAQNIRNKIKHPFYLAYYFSNAFKLFYNKYECQDALDCLRKMAIADKYFPKIVMIHITKETTLKKRILALFENWRFNFILVTFDLEQETSKGQKWVPISTKQILQKYSIFYSEEQGTNSSISLVPYPKREKPPAFQIRQQIVLQKASKRIKVEQAQIQN